MSKTEAPIFSVHLFSLYEKIFDIFVLIRPFVKLSHSTERKLLKDPFFCYENFYTKFFRFYTTLWQPTV